MDEPKVKGEVYPARRGLLRRRQWRGRVVSIRNGNTILVTPEGYNNRGECEAAILLVNPAIEITRYDEEPTV
jgi:uncharacterized protein YegP (UPF0339 family)